MNELFICWLLFCSVRIGVPYSSGIYSTTSSTLQSSVLQIFPIHSIVTGWFFPIFASAADVIPEAMRNSVLFISLLTSWIHNGLYDHAISPTSFGLILTQLQQLCQYYVFLSRKNYLIFRHFLLAHAQTTVWNYMPCTALINSAELSLLSCESSACFIFVPLPFFPCTYPDMHCKC